MFLRISRKARTPYHSGRTHVRSRRGNAGRGCYIPNNGLSLRQRPTYDADIRRTGYPMATVLLLATSNPHKGWFTENATLIVGVVGILVSGLVGPSIAARWTTRREREKDARAHLLVQRDDLRSVVDEAAKALGGAVARLRPALDAQLKGQSLPHDTRDFLAELFTVGQRLRLRAPSSDAMVQAYDSAREQLIQVARATSTQADFNNAAALFDAKRANFLDNSREVLNAPILAKGKS